MIIEIGIEIITVVMTAKMIITEIAGIIEIIKIIEIKSTIDAIMITCIIVIGNTSPLLWTVVHLSSITSNINNLLY